MRSGWQPHGSLSLHVGDVKAHLSQVPTEPELHSDLSSCNVCQLMFMCFSERKTPK